MSDYFEFKNIFITNTIHESQIASIPRVSSNISTPVFSDESSSGNLTDSSSPGYSDSETEVFESIETTYQVIGLVTKQSYWDGPEWWVVEIKDSEQIKKFDRPELVGISGLFKNINNVVIDVGYQVQVEITYKSNGGCLWKQNKIIGLVN